MQRVRFFICECTKKGKKREKKRMTHTKNDEMKKKSLIAPFLFYTRIFARSLFFVIFHVYI